MIDGVVGEFVGDGLAAHDAGADGVDAVGLDVFYVGEMDAVFVAEGEIGEEILEGVDAALGEEFGALGADAFDHADFGGEAESHQHLFISSLRGRTAWSPLRAALLKRDWWFAGVKWAGRLGKRWQSCRALRAGPLPRFCKHCV